MVNLNKITKSLNQFHYYSVLFGIHNSFWRHYIKPGKVSIWTHRRKEAGSLVFVGASVLNELRESEMEERLQNYLVCLC